MRNLLMSKKHRFFFYGYVFCADLLFIVIATKHIFSRSIRIFSVPRSSYIPRAFSLRRTMLGPCRPTGNSVRGNFAVSSTFDAFHV